MAPPSPTDGFSAADFAQLRTLARSLVSVQDADDLAHEAWIAGRGARHDGHPAWWKTVLRRRRAMGARAEGRRRTREARTEAPPNSNPAPDSALERARLCEALEAALGRLDAQDRALVVGRYCEGQTATELSAAFGLPASTVRTRLSRSLQRLRADLDNTQQGRGAWMAAALAWSPDSLTTSGAIAVSTSTTTKALAATALGSFLVACVAWTQTDTATSPTSEAVPSAAGTAAPARRSGARAEASSPAENRKRWESVRAAISTRRAKQRQAAPAPSVLGDETHEDILAEMGDDFARFAAMGPVVSQVLEQGVPLFVECLEALPEAATGKLHLRAGVIGEPDLGAIVESVEVVDNSLDEPAVEECLRESAYSIALDSTEDTLSKSLDITVDMEDRSLSVNTQMDLDHLTSMPTRDPELWTQLLGDPDALANLKTLVALPDIAEQHPEFAAAVATALAAETPAG